MYRVMLIEDEPPILNMVKEMIEAASLGFVVTQTAINGRQALKLLECKEKPDLIITDIRMPVMDGLQLMKELLSLGHSIPCIVLSGYSDFNYAREALQLHAFDYLLKPLKEDHLVQTLSKASELIAKGKQREELSYFKQCLRLPDESNTMSANPGYPKYQLMLIRKGNHRSDEWEELSPVSSRWQQRETDYLLTVLQKDVRKSPVWLLSGLTSNEKIAIRGISDPDTSALMRDEAAEMLNCWIQSEVLSGLPICLAISSPIRSDQMASTFRALREALAREAEIGQPKLWVQGDLGKPPFNITSELEHACRTVAKASDYRAFEKAIFGWKEEWKKESFGQLAIESLLSCVFRLFSAQWSDEGLTLQMSFEANELVFGCSSIDEAVDQFCGFMRAEYDRMRGIRPDRSAKDLIDKVRKYLDEHYMEQIGSETLQQLFGYHKTYISNVFSEVVGMPPGKYLAKLRIEKAIMLLNDRSDLSLRQIAEQIGYENSLYFSKVFKNATGLNPTEYRERRGET